MTTIYFTNDQKKTARRLFKEVSMHYLCKKLSQILHLNKTKIISALTLKFSKWGESMLLPKDMSNNFTKTIFSLNEYSRHYSG